MRVLVTGANGQVGHQLMKALAPLGPVVGVDRTDADLVQPQAVQRLLAAHQPEVIVNAAAYTAVDQAESEAQQARALNHQLPAELAQWARANGVFLVHFSTDYVYAGEGEQPLSEEAPTAPLSVYGQTKLAGDEAVREACPQAVILRTAWVYGARGRNFMRTMLRLAAERERLDVVADQWGAPTPAWLIAQVAMLAVRERLQARPLPGGVYHLTCRGATSWHGFASAIIDQAQAAGVALNMGSDRVFPISTEDFRAAAPRPANSRLDVTRVEQALQLTLPDWNDALALTLADWMNR